MSPDAILRPSADDLDAWTIDDRVKGIPFGIAPFRLGEIGAKGWNLLREDLPLPLAVLKRSALDHNLGWMARFVSAAGAVLAPHGKTTMVPALFREQVEHGAWAITVATVHQMEVARRHGIRRVVIANQIVGRQTIRGVLDALRNDPGFEVYALADSVANVEALAAAARANPAGRPLSLLVEAGYAGGRTGCRDLPQAMAVARAIKAAEPHLALRGVEGFEGLIAGATIEEVAGRVGGFLQAIVEMAAAAEAGGLFADGPIVLSAGGSAFYDIVVDRFRKAGLTREVVTISRSGCYVAHDSLMYRDFFAALRKRTPSVDALGPGLQPAMEVWGYVQSRPEREKAIVTIGRRDIGTDAGNPVPLVWHRPGTNAAPAPLPEGHVAVGFNDQHCHMAVPASSPLAVGDMIALGVSHPCTTFDKWQLLQVVDDRYDVVGGYRTFF